MTRDVRTTTGPIDRVAARVMKGGVHFDKQIPADAKHWPTLAEAPKLKRWPENSSPTHVNLTGRTFGLFTVVGYLGPIGAKCGGVNGKRMAMWLVRCTCGDFEIRSAKAIKNPANAEDRCIICRDVEYKRSGESDPRAWFAAKKELRT